MPILLVEVGSPWGKIEERWKIKVKKCVNIPADAIIPEKFQRLDLIKSLKVGRSVSEAEIRAYFKGYFNGRGMWENLIRMQLTK